MTQNHQEEMVHSLDRRVALLEQTAISLAEDIHEMVKAMTRMANRQDKFFFLAVSLLGGVTTAVLLLALNLVVALR